MTLPQVLVLMTALAFFRWALKCRHLRRAEDRLRDPISRALEKLIEAIDEDPNSIQILQYSSVMVGYVSVRFNPQPVHLVECQFFAPEDGARAFIFRFTARLCAGRPPVFRLKCWHPEALAPAFPPPGTVCRSPWYVNRMRTLARSLQACAKKPAPLQPLSAA